MPNTVAYGFHGLADIWTSGAFQNNTLIPVVRDALIRTAEEHNRQINQLLGTLVRRVTFPKTRVMLGGAGTLQPIDEWGNPLPTRGGEYYEIGFPIQGGGDAIGTNRVSRAMMLVSDINDRILDIQKRDADWVMRHALAAILDNASWTFTDYDPTVGNLTVKPLANGDTDKYAFAGGTIATDNHYRATASAISDSANPFPAIRKELDEHPENAGPFVAYVPSNLIDSVTALTEHIEKGDPNVVLGANADTLTSDGEQVRRFGNEVTGYLKSSRMWVVEWKRLPDNYIVCVALGSATPVLAMREYPAPELQGLFLEETSPDGNLREQRFLRYAGFGVMNRVGAVVQQIGNATYQVPAGYDAPLAI